MKKRIIIIIVISIIFCVIGLQITRQRDKEESYSTEATKDYDDYYIVEKQGELYCFGSKSEDELLENIKGTEYTYVEYGGSKEECENKIK